MDELTSAQGRELLALARTALREHLLHEGLQPPAYSDEHLFSRLSGAFVTLRLAGALRGCIGQTQALMPLVEMISAMAIAAGTRDPRFSPVGADELDQLHYEISVLGPLEACGIDQVRIGRDGLVVIGKTQRGLLLPEVAVQQGWDQLQFVENTCRKAGLPFDAVPLMADLYRFQTQHFVEGPGSSD